jgi:hypothetical protein
MPRASSLASSKPSYLVRYENDNPAPQHAVSTGRTRPAPPIEPLYVVRSLLQQGGLTGQNSIMSEGLPRGPLHWHTEDRIAQKAGEKTVCDHGQYPATGES